MRRLSSRAGLAAASLALASTLLTPTAFGASDTAGALSEKPAHPPLLAYYDQSLHLRSWERGKLDSPLIGFYSGSDQETMRLHVRWAQQAGIAGFIVRWRSDQRADHRLKKMVEVAEDERFKLAIYYQGLDSDGGPRSVGRINDDFKHLADSYGNSPAFGLFGAPLVIWKGTSSFSRDEVRQVVEALGGRLLVLAAESTIEGYERIADLTAGNARYWSALRPDGSSTAARDLQAMGAAVHARGGLWIAPATPGYGRALGSTVVDRRDGETLRRSLELANSSAPDAIGLISWNFFGDNTHIEPSTRFGMQSLEVVAALSGGLAPRREADSPRAVTALAYYYIWFERRSWERGKKDAPLLGEYSSDHREIMRRHVGWARQAGLDGFIVSWKSTKKLDRRLRKLREIAAEQDFKLAVIYQGLDHHREPRTLERVASDLKLFADTYGQDPVFDLFGQPLVIWNGTWKYSREQIAEVAAELSPRLLLLAAEKSVDGYSRVADLVDGNSYYWSSVDPLTNSVHAEKLAEMGAAVKARNGIWIAPAAPGYDARLIGGTQVVGRRDGETLRRSALAASLSRPDAIGFISWNEFSENTHLEPSRRLGTRYLEVLADLRGGKPDLELLRAAGLVPRDLLIQTVPPRAGIRFSLGGQDFVSGTNGLARREAVSPGRHELQVDPFGRLDAGTHWRFTRWESTHFDSRRTVINPFDGTLQAGLELIHPVRLRFLDAAGNPVDPSRIDSIGLRGPDGALRTFEDSSMLELAGNRVVRRLTGLESIETAYALESVEIDGANVVARGQQKIYPARGEAWDIRLRMYPARIAARDLLFGFGIGTGVEVMFPDATTHTFRFPAGHTTTLPSLARGLYEVRVTGAPGFAPITPVSVSRAQEIELPVISYLDVGVIITGGLLAMLALLRLGRPQLFGSLRAPKLPEQAGSG